ncbi:hypothetical protein CYMTET_53520 [Cymbomonas tetramitiformis]|uniref:Uncharacterized protein n=1 Tax=Cymbomonas tetramitiformis TaxID=36881 RepID=A0AAE0EPZ4_9CHLO|nr:hypothetical protein CYMTET_53520 [Cymbomonas tetramitiformis]|eukprot:gene10042-11885_t
MASGSDEIVVSAEGRGLQVVVAEVEEDQSENAVVTERKENGWLPLMASSSPFQIGALMAESICERVLSCANQVLVDGNTLPLSDAEIEIIVLLRGMNRGFMESYMRSSFGHLSQQQFNQPVINGEMEEDEIAQE